MTILVSGGAGYIGSHMVLDLLDRGESLVVVDNLSTGFRWGIPEGVTLIHGDVGDVESMGALIERFQIETIIHFAARTIVPESVADPLGYYLANTGKTRSLLAAAVARGIRHVIFSSTAAVYGDPPAVPVTEDMPTVPKSPYGTSKLMSEMMLRDAAAAHGLRYAILRYFNVAGADPLARAGQSTPQATHLIKVAVETAVGRRPHMEVFGHDYPTPDGTCIRDYIHVSDLVRAHSAALDHLRRGGENITLNCGYGRGYSVFEVIDTVRRVAGIDVEVRRSPRRPGDLASIIADNRRIRSMLGWEPRYDDLPVIVEHALAWERELMRRRGA